jgi:hypothetical protein
MRKDLSHSLEGRFNYGSPFPIRYISGNWVKLLIWQRVRGKLSGGSFGLCKCAFCHLASPLRTIHGSPDDRHAVLWVASSQGLRICKGKWEKARGLCVSKVCAIAQAVGKEQECIDLYKTLENTHPNPAIKRQAANLRFILEAPRLKLRPDEFVSVPVLKPEDAPRCALPPREFPGCFQRLF